MTLFLSNGLLSLAEVKLSPLLLFLTDQPPGVVLLIYSRHCHGSIEWAKYLHRLFTELSKQKRKLR